MLIKFVTICIGVCALLCMVSCGGVTEEKRATDALQAYVQNYLDTYKNDPRERVAFLGGGWVKEYFEVDPSSKKINVENSDSPSYPFIGQLDFQMVRHYTAFHHQRESALSDSSFVQSEVTKHRHNYIYQNGQWIPLADTDRDDSAP